MKFVFLILEYVPHQVNMIQEVLKNEENEVLAFSVNNKYDISSSFEARFVNYILDDFSTDQIFNMIHNFNPVMLVVGGWAYKKYNRVAYRVKQKLKIPVVTYSDTQWRGDWTQRVNCLISPFHLKRTFTHIWVAGVYQYEYARKLGFNKNQIIFNSLSCNVEMFNKLPLKTIENNYPKNFLYIGRFAPEKGLDYLLDAWNMIQNKNGWTLTLVGEGELKNNLFKKNDDVILKKFMTHDKLIKEMQESGCFVLPSIYEPWALVIHEAAAAGMPIVCTEVCGAAPHFVIDGYNGYKVQSKNSLSLKVAMEKIITLTPQELISFSKRSKDLSNCISSEKGVATLISILNR